MTKSFVRIVNIGGKQMLELPVPFRFPDDVKEVAVMHKDEGLLISPLPVFDSPVSSDFMEDREQSPPQERDEVF